MALCATIEVIRHSFAEWQRNMEQLRPAFDRFTREIQNFVIGTAAQRVGYEFPPYVVRSALAGNLERQALILDRYAKRMNSAADDEYEFTFS